jgi:voltage-gated potassium channel Kch
MISMVKIFEAIIAINPDAKVSIRGTSLDDFVVEYVDGTSENCKTRYYKQIQ